MTHYLHFSLWCLLGAVGLYYIAQSAGLIIRVKSRAAWTSPEDMVKAVVKRMSRPLAWVTVGALLGIPIGWNLHQPSEIKKMENVLIILKRSDVAFQVSTPKDGKLEKTFCEPPDFQPGEAFEFIKYRKERDCSNIRGPGKGFKAFTDPQGNRIKFPIQEASLWNRP